MDPPDWLGPACDCLREHSLDVAAEGLDRLERAIRHLEMLVASYQMGREGAAHRDTIALIAAHRGETPEQTLARLRPTTPHDPGDEHIETLIREAMAATGMPGRGHRRRTMTLTP